VWSRPPEGLHGVSEVQSRVVVRRRGGLAYICIRLVAWLLGCGNFIDTLEIVVPF